MDESNQKIEEMFDQTGIHCPYDLAKRLEIRVVDLNFLPGDIAGYYTMTSPNHRLILINSALYSEEQEDVCYKLVSHHLNHDGIPVMLTKMELDEEEEKKYQGRSYEELRNVFRVAFMRAFRERA